MKKLLSGLRISLALLVAVFANGFLPTMAAYAYTPPSPTEPVNKITICHATNSDTNPYTVNTPNADAVGVGGGNGDHATHTGPVWNPTLKDQQISWGDIIPPFTDEQGRSFDGLNWDVAGQAIYANDCSNVVAVPATPTVNDPCGPANATWNLPADTVLLDWEINQTGHLVVTVKHGLRFPDGTTFKDYGLPVDSGEPCEEAPEEISVPSGVADVCGRANDTVPLAGDNYTVLTDSGWVADGEDLVKTVRTITYKTDEGYVFNPSEGWTLSQDGTQATYRFTDWGTACSEAAPCTVTSAMYASPWVYDEVTYPGAGAWPESGVPASYEFKADGLHLSTPETASYVYGLFSAGNTRLSDIDAMSYKTLRETTSTGPNNILPGYVIYVDLDGNLSTDTDQDYIYYEPVYNGSVQTGVWQTWDVLNGGNSIWWSSSLTGGTPNLTWSEIIEDYPNAVAIAYGFNQGTWNQGTDSAVQDIVFDCATVRFGEPGKGGGTSPSTPPSTPPAATPVVPAATTPALVAPEVLPSTGGGKMFGAWMPLVSSLITYALVYRFQKKRQEQEA